MRVGYVRVLKADGSQSLALQRVALWAAGVDAGYSSLSCRLRTNTIASTLLGVLQDFVEAHRWYNLAASRLAGDQREEAATDRDAVAEQMTPVDLSEAHQVP